MPGNNYTSARMPLRLSESTVVLVDQIEGLITRKGAGPFQMTELGQAVAIATAAVGSALPTAEEIHQRLQAELAKRGIN